jgi:phage terminase large subunit-like protein
MAAYPLTNKASAYARAVVSGKIPACQHVINSCNRHLDDLSQQNNPSYPYRFDKARSEHILEFAEKMPHTKGKWKGSLIVLEPWQCFFLSVPFGWVRKKDNIRRFREILGVIPRKSG